MAFLFLLYQIILITGVGGFEPTYGDFKRRCLTAWRHPRLGKKGFEPLTP